MSSSCIMKGEAMKRDDERINDLVFFGARGSAMRRVAGQRCIKRHPSPPHAASDLCVWIASATTATHATAGLGVWIATATAAAAIAAVCVAVSLNATWPTSCSAFSCVRFSALRLLCSTCLNLLRPR